MFKKKNNNAYVRAEDVKKSLLNASSKNVTELLSEYENSYSGYTNHAVKKMRNKFGENIITKNKKDSAFRKLIDTFINPFTIVLIILALISFITKDIPAVVIITSMVLISGLLHFIQEIRSGKAAEKLSEMVETTITVQRIIGDDKKEDISEKLEIPLDEIVVGDIIYLAAGDLIPGDIRIISAKDLFINQSSLTGESEPIEKFSKEITNDITNPTELNNLAFMGCNVVSGSAIAMAIAVGDDTILGDISKQIQAKAPPTSFEKGVKSVSWVLIRFMLVMVPIVLFINGFTKGDWLQAFLFAISIAVGLTPEMLPMIVSANLAKGAVSMSKKKVIVKDFNAIQNFGAMDVLCTDKTGTITQDRVVLEYHLDIHGNEDLRVLRHAFLNSYFQTGLKNLMDRSIITKADEHNMIDEWNTFHKVDEIPFDFNRRRMSVVVADDSGKTQLITKGAIEEMLSVSSFVEYDGKVEPITDEIRNEVIEKCKEYNADGLRVLGISQKTNPSPVGHFSIADENEMVLIGYLAFLDPPKVSSKEAIATLQEYGVDVKVLTGDNDAVTKSVCMQVGIKADEIILGSEVEEMSDDELREVVENVNVFAKLSPSQKARIVTVLRENDHTVGFLGDGINDAAAMKVADVGISVDSAVEIAKESANLILMEKDLMVLEDGIIEGRKIYANIIKYIKMTASSNFGNMFSVLAASAFLPFLPMLPIQILILNLIYDISCITIPWDNVDAEYLKEPRKWNASSITKFMFWMGPSSSVFDIITFIVMYFIICPNAFGGAYHTLTAANQISFMMMFNAGWFVESLWSQTLVIHLIRTPKVPFVQSRASVPVILLTSLGIIMGTVLPYTFIGKIADMLPMPLIYFSYLFVIIVCYMILVSMIKKIFIKKYGELL